MANPTTNYSFAMPTNTDLVKDLPADFEIFGQAVDTQMKTNADAAIVKTIVDAKGDIIAATAADTVSRLAVGTNGQVLKANSATATGLEWGAAGGGLGFINRTTFSNVASIAIDNVFSSTYETYRIVIEYIEATTTTDNLEFQLRYGTTTETSGNYYGSYLDNAYNSGSWTINGFTGETKATLARNTNRNFITFDLFGVGQTTEFAYWRGGGVNYGAETLLFGGVCVAAQTYTGILFKSGSTNITGQIAVYGYAKA